MMVDWSGMEFGVDNRSENENELCIWGSTSGIRCAV